MMDTTHDPVVIVGAARTPLGAFQGELAALQAPQLGGAAIRAAVACSGVPAGEVEQAWMGCVLPAGLGQAPARQAALDAGLPVSTACTTVGKVCGSGMQAIMAAHDALALGHAGIAVAGGMESMSNAPYLLAKARGGLRIGHGAVLDHLMFDGLEDAYARGPDGARRPMGSFGEACVGRYGYTRAEQDAYAIESVTRAQEAARSGAFDDEIVPLQVPGRGGPVTIASDESPRRASIERIPTLKPAFASGGTITAASASSINDGAAALVLARAGRARALGASPIARIAGHAVHAQEPEWFSAAPVGAVRKLLDRLGWQAHDVDAWEVNEAFAVVAMVARDELGIPAGRLNVHGGACALGHPIGASGARIVVTLLNVLRRRGGGRGIATVCIGGGEATAIAVEML